MAEDRKKWPVRVLLDANAEKSTTREWASYFKPSRAQSRKVIIARHIGSQLPSYAYFSRNMIWVVGTQEIVPSVEEGMRRVRGYCLPLEDRNLKEAGFGGSAIGKILIFERETVSD